ncbi:DUF982 domain-containing protein [Nitratireductor sp. GCM10026969]|uniref:DUF982 domain-containing protein n=1 Tax=Nitratireductor sp. GCM10026969 TaxID=3252645 RepID=UPI00360DB911
MNTGRWSVPVSVLDGQGLVFDIRSARHAADFLVLHWPEKHRDSWPHLRAQSACLDVLQGTHEPEHAQQAFVEAARDAGIIAENP